ncbi:growth/differentiation factor 2 [Eucyclogobius newberryi]|uniref:growth/differentiation factor 2 n=1 Tax=Eucyclogobius newberryi TaxID=166745 RepID=UPI003B58E243
MLSISSFLLPLCLSLVVSRGKPLVGDVQTEDSEGLYSQLTQEDETKNRMANLLGTMKEDFLRKLNQSDVPQEKNKITPPQFMMELYNKYASDSSASPQSDVIRSFTVQDITLKGINGTKYKQRLMFNITIPSYEKITAAELQFFFQPHTRSKECFQGTVKVYELDTTRLLVGKEVACLQSKWETFDITASIQSWIRSGSEVSGFDVLVDTKDCKASHRDKNTDSCFNMSLSVSDSTSAALIVFSDDLGSRRREAKKELKEMLVHEEDNILHSDNALEDNEFTNEAIEAHHLRRKKRKAEKEYCRRTSLKVNFKEIGWDSWIVAPPEYDAFECRGLCYHPLTDESSPSKHALIQTILNLRNPKKANMACCVPIKLDPITVMYQENGRLTIRYLYEEMKVAECGCR